MTKKTVTSLALAAACAMALAVPAAQAQVNSNWSGNPALNNQESREYMRLLQTNWNFRQARIGKECGPITDMQLRQSCVASFDQYTPFTGSTRLAGNAWYPPNPASRGAPSTDMMSGSSAGTTTTGTTGYNPGMHGAGTDVQPSRTEQGYYRIR